NTSAGVNINNANSFGTGPVKWGTSTVVIAVPNNNGVFGGGDATAPFTIANAMQTRSASNLIFVSSTVAPVNWTGNWTLATGVSTITTNTDNTTFTISGNIAGTDATSALTKAGTPGAGTTRTLVLSGTNSYQGITTISAGTISVSNVGNSGNN